MLLVLARAFGLTIPRVDEPPRLDDFVGMAPDPTVTAGSAHVTDLVQREPVDGAAASERIEIYLGDGRERLHAVFLCYDSDPAYLLTRLATRAPGEWVFTSHVLRSKWSYQFTRALWLRGVIDYAAVLTNPGATSREASRRLAPDLLGTYLLCPGTGGFRRLEFAVREHRSAADAHRQGPLAQTRGTLQRRATTLREAVVLEAMVVRRVPLCLRERRRVRHPVCQFLDDEMAREAADHEAE